MPFARPSQRAVRRLRVSVVLLLALTSCAHSQLGLDPDIRVGRVDADATLADVPHRGALVTLQCRVGRNTSTLSGELLAVSDRAIWLQSRGVVTRAHRGCITGATLERHRSLASSAAAWTAFMSLSTLGHGALAILSAPANIVAGVAVAATQSAANDTLVLPHQLARMSPFARFPAGRPTRYRALGNALPKIPIQYYRLAVP